MICVSIFMSCEAPSNTGAFVDLSLLPLLPLLLGSILNFEARPTAFKTPQQPYMICLPGSHTHCASTEATQKLDTNLNALIQKVRTDLLGSDPTAESQRFDRVSHYNPSRTPRNATPAAEAAQSPSQPGASPAPQGAEASNWGGGAGEAHLPQDGAGPSSQPGGSPAPPGAVVVEGRGEVEEVHPPPQYANGLPVYPACTVNEWLEQMGMDGEGSDCREGGEEDAPDICTAWGRVGQPGGDVGALGDASRADEGAGRSTGGRANAEVADSPERQPGGGAGGGQPGGDVFVDLQSGLPDIFVDPRTGLPHPPAVLASQVTQVHGTEQDGPESPREVPGLQGPAAEDPAGRGGEAGGVETAAERVVRWESKPPPEEALAMEEGSVDSSEADMDPGAGSGSRALVAHQDGGEWGRDLSVPPVEEHDPEDGVIEPSGLFQPITGAEVSRAGGEGVPRQLGAGQIPRGGEELPGGGAETGAAGPSDPDLRVESADYESEGGQGGGGGGLGGLGLPPGVGGAQAEGHIRAILNELMDQEGGLVVPASEDSEAGRGEVPRMRRRLASRQRLKEVRFRFSAFASISTLIAFFLCL